jgi:hypothetical protein
MIVSSGNSESASNVESIASNYQDNVAVSKSRDWLRGVADRTGLSKASVVVVFGLGFAVVLWFAFSVCCPHYVRHDLATSPPQVSTSFPLLYIACLAFLGRFIYLLFIPYVFICTYVCMYLTKCIAKKLRMLNSMFG